MMQTLMMKNVMIAILMIIVDDCGQSMKIVANWGYQSSTVRHLLRMQRSSGQVIPPTNSKVAHPPNSAHARFLFRFLNSPKIASIGCFPQSSVVSGPIFAAANLFNSCSKSIQYLQRQIYLQHSVYQKNSYQPACSSNIDLCIINTQISQRKYFFAGEAYKRNIKDPSHYQKISRKRSQTDKTQDQWSDWEMGSWSAACFNFWQHLAGVGVKRLGMSKKCYFAKVVENLDIGWGGGGEWEEERRRRRRRVKGREGNSFNPSNFHILTPLGVHQPETNVFWSTLTSL